MHLRELSKEATQEVAMVHAKQIQYDRQIADMSLTISKLEANLKDATTRQGGDSLIDNGMSSMMEVGSSSMNDHNNNNNANEMMKQIKTLSEEVVRLRDKVATHNSESLAMKHRLRAATDKAQQLEEELLYAKSNHNDDSDMMYDSLERATSSNSNNSNPSSSSFASRRRKIGGTSSTSMGSIRSAMRLEIGHNERTEQIGQVVDAVDSFAVSTGKCAELWDVSFSFHSSTRYQLEESSTTPFVIGNIIEYQSQN
jgi:phage shock protein A